MCGIVGFTGPLQRRESLLRGMCDRLTHRGPDDQGAWLDDRMALGHRRLTIIDLQGGQQPMVSADGRFILSYNGEIYNYRELRRELEQDGPFQSQSDTEVLLRAWQVWGSDCLSRINGMFAFAVYDTRDRTLTLVRDRMGQKPLYYAQTKSGDLVFASEPRPLFDHPDLDRQIDPEALAAYLRFDYIPVPRSIYKGVSKLGGGQMAVFRLKQKKLKVHSWWQREWAENTDSEKALCTEFRDQLQAAVERRLVADVPLGIFLSGGIDSSSVAAMACRVRPAGDVKTFSIAFADRSFDESDHARRVANHLGTDHHCRELTPDALLRELPEIVAGLDEPFGDPSYVPTWLLSRFAREQVTVALGGDGADELFAGYPTFWVDRWCPLPALPEGLVRGLEGCVDRLPVKDSNLSFDYKLRQFVRGIAYKDFERVATWQGALTGWECEQLLGKNPLAEPFSGFANLYDFYQQTYLQEDILTKVDRASMQHGLEVRAPYLDVNLASFANRLHPRWKLRGIRGKVLPKLALRELLPSSILDRPKKGFGIPVTQWFKGPLKDDLIRTLDPDLLRKQGLFNPEVTGQWLCDLMEGRRNPYKPLWNLYIFQKWYQAERAR